MNLTPLQIAAIDQDRAMTEEALTDLVAEATSWQDDQARLLVHMVMILRAAQMISGDHVALLCAVAILRLSAAQRNAK